MCIFKCAYTPYEATELFNYCFVTERIIFSDGMCYY